MRDLLYFFLLLVAANLTAQTTEINYLTYNANGYCYAADMDNDGDLDVVHSNITDDEGDRDLVWYENTNGLGTLWETHQIFWPDNLERARIVIAEDITGDGWPDLILEDVTLVHDGNAVNPTFIIVANNLPDSGTARMQLADLDGDNDQDVLIRDYNSAFSVLMNSNQNGSFQLSATLVSPYPNYDVRPRSMDIGDIDGDGDLDIAAVYFIEQTDSLALHWYENTDGMGTFALHSYIDGEADNVEQMAVTLDDMNGDGLMDVLIHKGFYKTIMYQEVGQTWTKEFYDFGIWGDNAYTADLDGDGDIDYIEGESIDSVFYWYENLDNTGEFAQQGFSDSLGLYGDEHFQIADFDGDGDVDLLLTAFVGGWYNGVLLYKNNLDGGNSFSEMHQVSDNINGHLESFPMDLDGDDDNDILLFSQMDRDFHWLENLDGQGNFSTPNFLSLGDEVNCTLLKDLDGDGDDDIVAVTENEELVWYENSATTAPFFAPKQILATGIARSFNGFYDDLHLSDFDGDGDLDIAVHRASDRALFWYEHEAGQTFIPHLVSDEFEDFHVKAFADMNHDGLMDIVYQIEEAQDFQLFYFEQDASGAFSPVWIRDGAVASVEVIDIDNDLDKDVILQIYDSGYKLLLLINENNAFTNYQLGDTDGFTDFVVEDLDNDGRFDIYVARGWFKQLSIGGEFSSFLPTFFHSFGFLSTGDLNGDGAADMIFAPIGDDALVWTPNIFETGAFVEGRLAIDEDLNCDIQQDSFGLYGWIIDFQQDTNTYYTSTSPNGYYSVFLPDSGDYVAHVQVLNNYWESCVNDTLLLGLGPNTTTILDFPIQVAFDCPLMQVNITSGNLRPCLPGLLSVEYCNNGTTLAEDAVVEVLLSEFLEFDSVDHSYTETDSSYLFDVGDLDFLECGTIQIHVTPDCDSTAVGDQVCATAHVTPDSLCAPIDSLWDGSTIEVNGVCINDSIHFELTNIGSGGMSEARQFRVEIVNCDIVLMVLADTFKLGAGESKPVVVNADMEVFRIEADQDMNHPLVETADAMVTACADFTIPTNIFAYATGNPFSTTYCQVLTGSYDPNTKSVLPEGFSQEHFIDRDQELNYTIQFQNTGNDTAFTVVIKDPISEHLDLSTLRIGAASHAFNWSLTTQRELIFTFNNILLPDSTTNLLASQGYVQFFIKPLATVPFDTKIENKAGIYFDFNEPIITNETSQTIRRPLFISSSHEDVCQGEEFLGLAIQADTMIVDSTLVTAGLELHFYHLHVLPVSSEEVMLEIPYGELFNGVEITADTTIITTYTAANGCDSIIYNNISTIVNTSELNKEYEHIVYPQPAKDVVYLQWNDSKEAPESLTIFNADGRLMEQMSLESSENRIKLNVADLSSGVYWLRIDFQEESLYKRVVKF